MHLVEQGEAKIIRKTLSEAEYDNTPGIRDSIFELYIKSGTKDRHGEYGYGIGLATVKNLVQAQGGSIDFTTEMGREPLSIS